MSPLSRTIVEKFCSICAHAFNVWSIHRAFEDSPSIAALGRGRHAYLLSELSEITQSYVLHEIVKLHDRAISKNSSNLTLNYVIEFGEWDIATQRELEAKVEILDAFARSLRDARNKILSHNDLKVILAGSPLGAFEKNEDKRYFDTLFEFVNIVHDRVIGGPYQFPDQARHDVALLIEALVAHETASGFFDPPVA